MQYLRLFPLLCLFAVNAAAAEPIVIKQLKFDNTWTTDSDLVKIVANNPELVELTLGHTKITDAGLAPLKKLTKLRKLRISNNTAITDKAAETLAEMPSLQDIDVSQTSFGNKGLAQLRTLPNLKRLNLYTTAITDSGLDVFAEFKSAEKILWLNIDKCSITDAAAAKLAPLKNLQWIHFGRTELTDTGLEILSRYKTLKEVSVTNTKVTPAGVEKLQAALPECKVNAK
ncbi:MAG: hypothetical protein LBT89_11910 [Planctomycetaceae bacterium]|jgi:Leucine-rich repeat (LRR) protein|nr:hypothetical protein [Planctomycetaceae bacterium]